MAPPGFRWCLGNTRQMGMGSFIRNPCPNGHWMCEQCLNDAKQFVGSLSDGVDVNLSSGQATGTTAGTDTLTSIENVVGSILYSRLSCKVTHFITAKGMTLAKTIIHFTTSYELYYICSHKFVEIIIFNSSRVLHM